MTQRQLAALVLLASFLSFPAAAAPAKEKKKPNAAAPQPVAAPALRIDAAQLRGLKARSIGPAVMGGRVSDIALDPENPFTFYVGFATGGLFKTSNDGTTWDALFEKESVHSIGAVAVAPSDPKTIWVGTGEGNDRNTSAWGNGVYLSTDGGETWKNVGLKTTRAIARIVVDAKDPKSAWVAAPGDLWAFGGERGLYRTTDSGATWRRALAGGQKAIDRVGCGDVAVDPADGNVVYAALYARRRTPWSFESGPAASGGEDAGGIFKSTDAGATWKKLTNGLPSETGRIGLSVFRKDPRIVYAVVQSMEGGSGSLMDVTSKHGGVFRSEDGGETFARKSKLNPRPFYFSQIRVDPENDKRVYLGGFSLHVSEDGGASFREDMYEKVHPDIHAIAIDPRAPKRVLLGNDGGVYESFDAAKSWRYLNNIAAGEFYRVSLDSSHPFRICGGLQDNYSWVGPSAARTKDGILNSDWINLGGGDGFGCAFDPSDPNIVYFESQGANVERLDLVSGEVKRIRPEAGEGQQGFRFHWNSPLVASRKKGTLLLGGNRILRLSNRGTEWTAISPELVSHDAEKMHTVGSGAETYGTVYTISESPVADGVIWAGTDDGKLWLTENDGEKWTELTAGLPAAGRGHWISRVEAGRHDASTAYVAIDAHRTGSLAPLAYVTRDKGRTWQSIAGNLAPDGPVKVVREDAKNPAVLYAGTEFGLFVSFDRGSSWSKLGELPTVAVDDIQIHPETADMVIATHGRSLYVIDDASPLQALGADLSKEDLHLFAPPPAYGFYPLGGVVEEAGKGVFHGESRPEGALLTFWVGAYTGEPVSVSIANAQNQTVAKLKPVAVPGLNRVTWDLKPTKDFLLEYGGEGKDKFVAAGEYTVTLSRGKTKLKEKLRVAIAPGIETR